MSGIPSNIPVKKLASVQNITSPILYTSVETLEEIKYTFLIDKYITSREVHMLRKVIDKKVSAGYQIIYALRVILTEKDLEKGVYSQYSLYKWDYKNYIPKWSKIISFGRSIFSLTDTNDLDCSLVRDEDSDDTSKKKDKYSIIQGFYDTLLWKTSFFHPELSCEVYPVDEWENFLDDTGMFKNNFEYWFLQKQIKIATEKSLEPFDIKPIKVIVVENPNEFLKEHNEIKEITGYDIETNGLDPWKKKAIIKCVTLSFMSDPYTGYYLRFKDINKFVLSNFLKDRPLIGTNIKFDAKFSNYVAKVPLTHINIHSDTMQLQHICNEMMRKGLKAGAWLYTYYGGYDRELDIYLDTHTEIKGDYSKIPEPILAPYAATDPCISLLVHKALVEYRDTLDVKYNSNNPYGYNLKWCYENVIVPTLNLFTETELLGMTLNAEVQREQSLKLLEQVNALEKEILIELKEDKSTFNLSSPDQLGIKLEKLGWPISDRNKKKIPTTGEDQLKDWEKKGKTLATKILKYREIRKMLTTYVGIENEKSGMYKWIRDDGKIHTNYNNFLALSWRHTSSKPNGQNFVSHGEKAKIVRSFITPNNSPDYAFLSTDYSGLQLRLAAMVSNDEQMVRAFKLEGGDIHMRTAYNVMLKYMTKIASIEEAQNIRKGEDDEAKFINDMRFKSKSINFGLLFGAQASTIMMQSIKPNWKEEDVDSYIQKNKLSKQVKEHYLKIEAKEYKFIYTSLNPNENMLNAKYFTIAVDVRQKFFEAYTGLETWINETRQFAIKNGYVISVYGAIRRLPYLTITSGQGYDVNYGPYSNYLNIALNSPIQNMEAIVMNRSLVNIWKWIKENKREDKIFSQIHDAQEYYMLFTEEKVWKEFVTKVHEFNEQDYPEYKGIPLEVESNLADYYGKGELWDMGIKINPKHFKVEHI